jgi:peptidylprolyl isomerase
VDSSAPTKPATPANRKPTPAEARRAVKNQRKNSAREALRKQEAARRQRNAWLGAFGALVLVVVTIVLINVLHGSKAKPVPVAAAGPQAIPSAAASAPPSAAPSAAPSASGPPFPGVPTGESATLKTQPKIAAGTGPAPTALKVTTLVKGTGPVVKSGDTITVNYIGATYVDGKVFDSSWSRKQTFPTAIGTGAVIPGWDKGLVGVTVGSRVQLDIPQSLAYPTATAANGQPVGALRFIVDILSDSSTK